LDCGADLVRKSPSQAGRIELVRASSWSITTRDFAHAVV
jgi:hypothetical protein